MPSRNKRVIFEWLISYVNFFFKLSEHILFSKNVYCEDNLNEYLPKPRKHQQIQCVFRICSAQNTYIYIVYVNIDLFIFNFI